MRGGDKGLSVRGGQSEAVCGAWLRGARCSFGRLAEYHITCQAAFQD